MGKGSREKKARKSKRRTPGKSYVKAGFTQYNSTYARRPGGTVEKKYKDTVLAHQDALTPNGTVYGSFLTIPQDQTVHGRIGNKVTVVNANFRGEMEGWSGAYAGLASQRIRTIWFWDTQANGGVPKVNDVLQTAALDSFRNMEQAPRYIVLQDKTHVFNHQATQGTTSVGFVANNKQVKFSWRGSSPIHYGNAGGELAGIRSNNLCLLVLAAIPETGSKLHGEIRVKYTDA